MRKEISLYLSLRNLLVATLAGLLCTLACSPSSAASQAPQYTAEILNFPGAPFELLSGPDGETGPNWAGLESVSFYVHNLSKHSLERVFLRLARLWVSPAGDHLFAWAYFPVDLGPGGLEPGGTTYLLMTRGWAIREGSERHVFMPAAPPGRPEGWARAVGSQPSEVEEFLKTVDRGETQTKVMARSPVRLDERPRGMTACAERRRAAEAGCPWGFETFVCVAPRDGEPSATIDCASAPGAIQRARLERPDLWAPQPEAEAADRPRE